MLAACFLCKGFLKLVSSQVVGMQPKGCGCLFLHEVPDKSLQAEKDKNVHQKIGALGNIGFLDKNVISDLI